MMIPTTGFAMHFLTWRRKFDAPENGNRRVYLRTTPGPDRKRAKTGKDETLKGSSHPIRHLFLLRLVAETVARRAGKNNVYCLSTISETTSKAVAHKMD